MMKRFYSSPAIRKLGLSFLLIIILLASLVVRVWGARFGLPEYVYHPDEKAIVERAARILSTGDFNPHAFRYPSLYIYIQASAYAIYFLWGAAKTIFRVPPDYAIPQYYLVGRLTTALIGTATVVLIYKIGREIANRRLGLISAALLGFTYLHGIHSHYVTGDVPVTFFMLLSFLCSASILRGREVKPYALAGLFAGMATAVKYNGGVVIASLLVAHLLSADWEEWLDSKLVWGVVFFALGFLISTPYALPNLPTFLTDLATVLNHYRTTQPGFMGDHTWLWHLKALFTGSDTPLMIVATIGFFSLLIKPKRAHLLLLSFPLLYFLAISSFRVHFERNLVPLLPFTALFAAYALDRAVTWLAARRGCQERGKTMGLCLAVLLLLLLPATSIVQFDRLISRKDERTTAGEWVGANIPAGSKIAVEHYSIPFPRENYEVEDVLFVGKHTLEWYQKQGFDYVIISDGVWERLLAEPEVYREEAQTYSDILEQSTLLAEFQAKNIPTYLVRGYPTVRIYHFPRVQIFRLERK